MISRSPSAVFMAVLSLSVPAWAAAETVTAEPAAPAPEPTPPGDPASLPPDVISQPAASPPSDNATPDKPGQPGRLGSISWRDIVTVQRRPILKYHRVELVPTYNLSLDSSVIRHHGFGGMINFFLSETLFIGIEATYLQQQVLPHYFLRGLDDRVLPAVNRYRWSAAGNFGYVPLYGKFSLFNRLIFQWEAYVQAGLGVIQTEWIPRDPELSSNTNFNVLWHIDLGTRVFLTKWLVFQAYIKDNMFIDNFEPNNRPSETKGDTRFVNNVVFGVGVGMFLPTNFEYKYTR